jgi:hypothetical protein
MEQGVSMKRRNIALLLVGLVLGAALITPAGAHVGGSVGHVWKKHMLPLAKKAFYTKTQSNARYMPKSAKTVVAYAHIAADGTLDTANSYRVNASDQYNALPGLYCIDLATTAAEGIQVTLDGLTSGDTSAVFGDPFTSCDTGDDVSVMTSNSGGAGENRGFYILFY